MKTRLLLALVVVALLVIPLAVQADEQEEMDPLLALLIEQGVITAEQARAVQAEYDRRRQAAGPDRGTPLQPVPVAEVSRTSTTEEKALPKGIAGLSIGTLAYLSYQDGGAPGRGSNASVQPGDEYSRFTLKRGYLNVTKKITPFLEARITPDAHQDSSGNWKLRLKYLYAKLKWSGGAVINKPYLELGLAHMPWLDFEEHINRFRLQDTMFMERNKLFNSADAGIMLGANLGEELPADYRTQVNDTYTGRFGSFQVGIFNGGGYHASEQNSNKVLEGRLSLRPLPEQLPGLQVSLFALSGKGNVADDAGQIVPDWTVRTLMLSYESRSWVATAQYYDGEGNQAGSAVGSDGRALGQDGYSLFSELRCPQHEEYSLFARYDSFDSDTADPDGDVRTRWIAGIAWQFSKGNYWVLDYDRLEHSLPGAAVDDRLQLTLQLKY